MAPACASSRLTRCLGTPAAGCELPVWGPSSPLRPLAATPETSSGQAARLGKHPFARTSPGANPRPLTLEVESNLGRCAQSGAGPTLALLDPSFTGGKSTSNQGRP